MDNEYFEVCTLCQHDWDTLDDFLHDNSLDFNGYQANFKRPGKGIFFFTHLKDDCKSTISVNANNFYPVLEGEVSEREFAIHGQNCPGFCADKSNLNDCKNEICPGSFIRNLIGILKVKLEKSCKICIDLPKLMKRLDSNKQLVSKMLKAYCTDMPKKLNSLRQAIKAGDIAQIKMRADNIKGASVNINANLIAKAALKVELAMSDGNVQEAHKLFSKVETEYERLHKLVTNPLVLSDL